MKTLIALFLIFITIPISAQTSGPVYIKNTLIADGVYNAPNFEFTTNYDSYNTTTVNGTIRGVLFDGVPYSQALNGENKTKIFAWYGEPAGLSAGEKVPAVILVHGGGGEAYAVWVAEWVNRGYIAIAMSNGGSVPDDSETWEYGGPAQSSFFSDNQNPLQDQWFYHSIASSMLCNSLLRDDTFTTHVDKNNIGITGISWGGIINTVIAGIDERLDFAIPVYGCGFLYDSPIYSRQFSIMSSVAQKFYLENWEPSLYTPLHTAPMLFVDGNKDLQFTLNIFGKTYETSNSAEKFLRIEHLMGHGHTGGRRPEEIYDFADYVTGFNPNAVKPLEFTSETIDNNREITYEYNFEGAIDEAVLFYSKDTLSWGKDDDKFIWLTKSATLTKSVNSGIITTTVPDEAQVYYVNINNTTDNLMYSSVLKYINRDYDWYNHSTGIFNTQISTSSGGILTDGTSNPNTSGINTSSTVGKFVKSSGEDAKIVFNLNENITNLSSFKQKIKLYLNNSDLSNIQNKNIKIYASNSAIDYKTSSIGITATISESQLWVDYTFDFSTKTIPADISNKGGINQVTLVFAPDDITTNGTIYYFDNLRGTINQPEYVAPELYYDWLNYSENSAIEEINYASKVGGTYTKLYDVSLDTGITSSESTSGIATKFTKTTEESWKFAQMRYDFEDGAIKDTESITFKLKALFKPETISEINILNEDSRSVSIYLQDRNGGTNLNQTSQKAYFTEINVWETLEFTFTLAELTSYDRLLIMVTSGLTYPIDENRDDLINEDLVYYIESLTANENISSILSIDDINMASKTIILYPNPVTNELNIQLNSSVKAPKMAIFNTIGQMVISYQSFNESNTVDISKLPEGTYIIKVTNKNNEQVLTKKFVKQ
jgi:hypothetical protein